MERSTSCLRTPSSSRKGHVPLTQRGTSANKHLNDEPLRQLRNTSDYDEIDLLDKRIIDECPERGYAPPLNSKVKFATLPISQSTLLGLSRGDEEVLGKNGKKRKSEVAKRGVTGRSRGKNAKDMGDDIKKFIVMTDIQHAVIPHALKGRDILGAAKTGSGKTLAFLVPLVEKLYRCRWSPTDGPGAILLSPTRELAMQIFDVLRVVGSRHHLSAALLVGGGKCEFALEQVNVVRTNIIVATPGRLLQHLEETPYFDTSELKVLVLDEADRVLDMGFCDQLRKILEYLPNERQTMLFSATQTRNVKDLARLSLVDPEYIGVHDKETIITPISLIQSMMVCPLDLKLDLVFSFIKSHLKKKSLIFFSTCSQVRFVNELFCRLQPGVSLMCLHGKIKQERRTKIYFDFIQKQHAVMFATDLAARGLDFPGVDWVVQADMAENKETYIHRVGRTARYVAGGHAMLMVLPSEQEGVEHLLKTINIPIKTMSMNPDKAIRVSQKAASLLASDANMNRLARKSFTSYIRAIALMPNKEIFNVSQLPMDGFATSLGLSSAPSTKFLKKVGTRDEYRTKKNRNYKLERLKEQIRTEKLEKKIDSYAGGNSVTDLRNEHSSNDDDELLVVKRKHEWEDKSGLGRTRGPREEKTINKRIRIIGTNGFNKKVVFDDNEEATHTLTLPTSSGNKPMEDLCEHLGDASEKYMQEIRERMSISRNQDLLEEKKRIRDIHRKSRLEDKHYTTSDGFIQEEGVGSAHKHNFGTGESEERIEGSSGSDDETLANIGDQEEFALALLNHSTS